MTNSLLKYSDDKLIMISFNSKVGRYYQCAKSNENLETPATIFPDETPPKSHGCPVDDLDEGDRAEPKEKTKEAAEGGDKLNRSHRDPSLQFF